MARGLRQSVVLETTKIILYVAHNLHFVVYE